MLCIISTPLGNLGDMSQRAIETLKNADLIVAEDTRRTINLLKHLGIEKKRMTSFDRHAEKRKTPYIIAELKEGKNVALVSDSGTPGINDPGEYLIKESINAGIQVSPVPGPSAIITALVCSGLPTKKFTFYGFAPKKENEKKRFFEDIKDRKETKIFYESPYRVEKTMKLIADIMPENHVCIARELTKMHEEFIRGTAGEVYGKIKGKDLKGEIVIIIK